MQTVFDLGMHNGEDTGYYLARGYRVIAVEPNPSLVARAADEFAPHIASGRLVIVAAAIADEVGQSNFYISGANSEWSSLDDWRVSSQGAVSQIVVATTTLAEIIRQFGAPHYIKCDIEGADGIFCRQLVPLTEKPLFVSVEGIALEWLALLCAAGYTKFQLSNQARIRRWCPSIKFTSDGVEREWRFGSHSSGPFGDDLDGEWLSFHDVAQRWLDFARLKAVDKDMVLDNWFDFHARLN